MSDNMRVIIACDLAIRPMVLDVIAVLRRHGVDVCYAGRDEVISSFTRSAELVAKEVQAGRFARGVVFCGSGMGVCIAANKFRGIRAGLAYDILPAALAASDSDTNVLCTGAWMFDNAEKCAKVIETWLMCGYAGYDEEGLAQAKGLDEQLAAEPVPIMPAHEGSNRVVIGCDARGSRLAHLLLNSLQAEGVECTLAEPASGHYLEATTEVCRALRGGDAERGIVVSATGQDANIVANKHKGLRSAICFNPFSARLSRVDTRTNVLCLSSMGLDDASALAVATTWLTTSYYGNNVQGLADIASFDQQR